MKNFNSRKRFGFTLIELLIAVSLFAIAVAISAGGFVRALRTQRQLMALISANSSASLAIEQMARAIRTGYEFSCEKEPGGACEEIVFRTPSGNKVTYFLTGYSLQVESDGGEPQSLLPADTEVRYLNFILMEDPNYPPRVTINMGVTAKSYGLEGNVTNLQTTVSSRNF